MAELCRRFGVRRLDAFGSAVRGADFDPAQSDVDVLVEFGGADDLAAFLDFKEALEALLGRPVDLVERQAVEASRNPTGMRHRLIHGYAEVRLDVVWAVVKNRLPPLLATLEPLLPPGEDEYGSA